MKVKKKTKHDQGSKLAELGTRVHSIHIPRFEKTKEDLYTNTTKKYPLLLQNRVRLLADSKSNLDNDEDTENQSEENQPNLLQMTILER